jgi:hypothetical protein
MGPAESNRPTSIFGASQECLALFKEYLLRSASTVESKHGWAESQVAAFLLWARSIGVFAQGRMSVDFRLKDYPDIQSTISDLLEALRISLQRCTFSLPELSSSNLHTHLNM